MGCRAWPGWWDYGGVVQTVMGGERGCKALGKLLREVQDQLGMVALLPWD